MDLSLGLNLSRRNLLTLPPGAIMRIQEVDGVMTDVIGILISDAPNIDPDLWSIIFNLDGEGQPVSVKSDADIFAAAKISPLLNMGTMIGRAEWGIAIYAIGTPEVTLLKACKVAKVVYGAQFYDFDLDGKSVFGTPDIGAYEYT